MHSQARPGPAEPAPNRAPSARPFPKPPEAKPAVAATPGASEAYFARVNPDLLARLPLTARCVLELGCGAGRLGEAFRRRSPQAKYLGIELDGAAGAAARRVLDDVLEGNIEQMDDARLDSFLAGRMPDTLVFGDVLEHLGDPLATLKRLVARLEPGGVVVACIPNIGHWSIIEGLLRGQWTYDDEGLLDRTHLRFFTQDSARALLRDAGLVVSKEHARNVALDPKRQDEVIGALGPAAAKLGIDPDALAQRLRALQYVMVGVKPPFAEPLNIQQMVLAPDFMQARTDIPAQAINTLPNAIVTNHRKRLCFPAVPSGHAKILVIQRQIVMNRAAWTASIRSAVRNRWLLLAEWDDHPDLLPKEIKARWEVNAWLPLTLVHAVQTSTNELAEAFAAYNPHVFVAPNGLMERPPLAPKPARPIRIVTAALNRENANGLIAPALDRTLAGHPDCELVVVHNRPLFELLHARFPRQVRYHESLPYADYLRLLESCHVGLLPLAGAPAERFKTDLKFQEFASRGVACIASPTVYAASIHDAIDGFIARSPDDWTDRLTRLVEDESLRARMAARGWETLQDRLQSSLVGDRVNRYRELWRRRDELTASLLERHPELR